VPVLAPWQQRLAGTAAGTFPGILVRVSGGLTPYPLQVLAYGAAVVAAAFILAWACEAAQVDVARGAVVAAVAFVAILPEYIVEVHFAFSGRADYVTANLTGASRLLLGVCVALPAVVAVLPRRWRPGPVGPIVLVPSQRVELGILAIAGLWALRGAMRGRLTILDAVVLISLYALYLRRASASESEAPAPIGVAAALSELPAAERRRWVRGLMLFAASVILLTAVPFGDAVLGSGALVGISPYLLLQWIVPVATEVPELVVAFVLLTHGRGGQSVAVLLAGAVSQYTLAVGTLPIAYLVGAGTGPLPLAGRERIELLVSVAVALYAVAALITLRLSRGDAGIMLVLFSIQFLLPAVVTRLALALAFMTIAIDVLVHERRYLPSLMGALLRAPSKGPGELSPPGRSPDSAAQRSGEIWAVPDPTVDVHRHELEPRHPAAAGDEVHRLDVNQRVADRHHSRDAEDRAVYRGASEVP
jgi:cation:H+ antiporter